MKEKEVILKGGRSAESVVKIGQVVHRSKGDNFEFYHELLNHLERNNFPCTPRFLGLDKQGREKLTYINGSTLLGDQFDEQQLISTAMILRAFHDVNSKSILCGNYETICHNDFAPWNIIFDHNQPTGIIDFDEAAPGNRIEDVAYFIWTFLDFGVTVTSDAEQISRIALLSKAYGLANPNKLIDAFLAQQNRILEFRKRVIANEKDEQKRIFSEGAVNRILNSMRWVETNQKDIEQELFL